MAGENDQREEPSKVCYIVCDEGEAMSVRSAVFQQIENVVKQRKVALASLADELALLDSGLDSLCLAVVVARLEDELGVDPFNAVTAESRFPVTIGDFVWFYEHAVSKKQA